jgi:cellulose synthase/poly-beta-1,6-N-acetylglucosamine synthase-like glycosyltransferase
VLFDMLRFEQFYPTTSWVLTLKKTMGWITWGHNLCENAWWCPKLWSLMTLQKYFMNAQTLVPSWKILIKYNLLKNQEWKEASSPKFEAQNFASTYEQPMISTIHTSHLFPNHVFANLITNPSF